MNEKVVLNKKPQGFVDDGVFKYVKEEIPELKPGQILLKLLLFSLDPYLRGRVVGSMKIGDVMESGGIYRVEKVTDGARFKVGDLVFKRADWSRYLVTDGEGFSKVVEVEGIPLSYTLGVLGYPGMTGYGGCSIVLKIKKEHVLVVNAACGAVGSFVGQMGKILGCKKVVGIAGGEKKCNILLKDYGFDAAIDYKKYNTKELMTEQLKLHCPDGIDRYFDNVGGFITQSIWKLLNVHARVAICGQISVYNAKEPPLEPAFLFDTIYRRVTIKGMLVHDFVEVEGFVDDFVKTVGEWLKQGKMKYKETVVEGFENIMDAWEMLYRKSGEKVGKLIVKL